MKMLSIERCKEVLNNGSRRYTDSEVRVIRDFLMTLADIEMSCIESELTGEKGKVIKMNDQSLTNLKAA